MSKPIIDALREATHSIHERLHHHDGLKALRDGMITVQDYVILLQAIGGFYARLAPLVESAVWRLELIERDLSALQARGRGQSNGLAAPIIPNTPAARLGAEYVIEGSALGGRILAAGAARVLGNDPRNGYQFFTGNGDRTGVRWRNFTLHLETAVADVEVRDVTTGAVLTFLEFESSLSKARTCCGDQ